MKVTETFPLWIADQAQVTRLGGKNLYLMGHVTGLGIEVVVVGDDMTSLV